MEIFVRLFVSEGFSRKVLLGYGCSSAIEHN